MKWQDGVMLVGLAMLWGGSFMLMRIAAPEFGPVPLMTVRLGLAALVLLPLLLLNAERRQQFKQHLGKIAFVGVVNSLIPFCLYGYASLTLASGFTSILNATAPLFGAVIALLWFGQRLARPAWLGLLLGVAGVVILVWDKLTHSAPILGVSSTQSVLAMVAAMAAAACYGFSANYIKKYLQGVASLTITVGSLIAAALVILPLGWLYWPAGAVSLIAWQSAVALAVLCTSVAYLLYFKLLSRIGAAPTMTVTFLIPLFAVILGAVLLDEPLSSNLLVGGAVVVLGTALGLGALNPYLAKLQRKSAAS